MGRRSYFTLGGMNRNDGQREITHLITETCQKRVSNCQNSMAGGTIYRTCELEPVAVRLPAHKCCQACLGEEDAVHVLRRDDSGWKEEMIRPSNPSSH